MSITGNFGKYLVNVQQIDADIVNRICDHLNVSGDATPDAIANALVTDYKIDYDTVYSALARHYAFGEMNIPVDSIQASQIKQIKKLHKTFDEELLRQLLENRIFPLRYLPKKGDILQILAANPLHPLIQSISKDTRYKHVDVYWSKRNAIESLTCKIANCHESFLDTINEAPQVISQAVSTIDDVDEMAVDEEINRSILVDIFDSVLIEAVRQDASDIHIIPSGRMAVELYLRVDGRLQLWHRQEGTPAEALAAVVKDRCVGIDRFERDSAQDGYAQRIVDDHLIRYRVSILPIVSAEYERRFESIVIRVIDDRKVITDFHKLGFQTQAEDEFVKSINTSRGIVIVTGPTGSGKSTTLMAALNNIITPSLNVLTCEDPVEYVIKGARQLKIGHKMTFDQAMRSILRHDPDVVMVGEIRDKITADIAVKLANTGHLTLSTLHTNDAPSAITRLYKMGIEPFLLAYSINIIIAQRLVRKLCEHCKEPISADKYPAALQLGLTKEELDSGSIFQAVGCDKCNDGFRGRINIAEALYFYPEIRAEIIRNSTEIDEERIRNLAQARGMLSMRDSGIARIREGLTSVAEVLYATTEE